MPTPTNPYYQRAFSALAGTLARARAVVNEFALVQRGFDLIGTLSGTTKYQLSCSDLTTSLTADAAAAYFRVQRGFTVTAVRASLLVASTAGQVQISIKVNGIELCSVLLNIDVNERTSTTALVQHALAFTSMPDDAEVLIGIVQPGTGAKGLIVSLIGVITS